MRPDHSIDKDWVPTEVHDWEGNEASVLVLNYTMACPLQCDFCCYSCGPKRTETMSTDLAAGLIRDAAELGVFSSIAFTGGEPLLFVDEITGLSEICREVGLPITMATAAHWGRTESRALRILEPLARNGLIRLNISADPSHQAFIPKSSVVNAARAASGLGIRTYVVGTFDSPEQTMAAFLPELLDLPLVKVHEKYVASVGRAATNGLTQEHFGLRLGLEDLSCYRRIHHDIVVWHDGMVYPCCSTFNRSTPGIAVGNVSELSLRDIWVLTEGNLMLRIMKRQGFDRFYRVVAELDPELAARLPHVEDTLGPCSLCNRIFRDDAFAAEIKALFARYEARQIRRTLALAETRLGPTVVNAIIEQATHEPAACSNLR